MKILLKAVLTIVFLTALVNAQSKVGTTAGNFLQIGVGGRAVSMGESGVTSGLDLSAIYWNPALGVNVPNNQAYFNNISWLAGITLNYGAVMFNLGSMGNVAAVAYVLNSGEMEVTTELRPEGTGELFTVQEMMIGLSYSRSITQRFNIGATFKYIHSGLWNMNASAIAVDLGITYQTPYDPLVIGMSISNFGTSMQLQGPDAAIRFDPDPQVDGNNDGIIAYQITRSWELPVTFRFGAGYDVIKTENHKILLTSDFIYPNNYNNYANVGAEYGLQNRYFLRAGYRQLFIGDSEGGPSFGAGLIYKNILVDYAYADFGRLTNVQYISFALSF